GHTSLVVKRYRQAELDMFVPHPLDYLPHGRRRPDSILIRLRKRKDSAYILITNRTALGEDGESVGLLYPCIERSCIYPTFVGPGNNVPRLQKPISVRGQGFH